MQDANCCFVLPTCVVMWGLYVDYSSSAMEHMYSAMHICPGAYANNLKLCMPEFLFTLLIALGS